MPTRPTGSRDPGGDDPCAWLPDGSRRTRSGNAAIFYIHPTTYLERDRWNAPLDDGGDTEFRTKLFVQSQASASTAPGEIWAPRYRQAAYGAFLLNSADAQKALDLAYARRRRGVRPFLAEAGDRPDHPCRAQPGRASPRAAAAEKVAGKPIARRIVAAYVVGWPISTAADLPALGLPACTAPRPDRLHPVVEELRRTRQSDLVLEPGARPGSTGGERRKRRTCCASTRSPARRTAPPRPTPIRARWCRRADLTSATLAAGQGRRALRQGLADSTATIPPLGPFVLPGNNYHVYDYALFWGAIRRDAERRLAAWQR